MLKLNIAFDDSNLLYTVDVVDLKSVSSQFKKIIDDQKVFLMTVSSKFTNNDWTQIRLGDFAPFSYGKPLLAEKRDPSGDIPIVGPGGIVGYHDVGLTTGHTIVIGRAGTVGMTIHYFSGPCWPIDTTFYVTGTDPLLMRFKYYLLQTLALEQIASGTVIPRINRTAAHAIQLVIPDEQEQKNIAHILGTLGEKIDLYRKMNQVLDDMARTLFKSWFVDFDPVRNKMNGRWQSNESFLDIPARFYDLFPNQLMNSELLHVPKEWKIRSIGDIANIVSGATTKIDVNCDEGVHCWVTPRDLYNLHTSVLLNTKQKITHASLEQTGVTLLPAGVVLFSFRDAIGHNTAITEMPVAISRELIAMLPYPGISSHFLHRWCEVFRDEMLGGTTFLKVSKSDFQKIPLVIPSADIMSAYHNIASILHSKIVINERSLSNLIAQRDELLPQLISGKLRISVMNDSL